MIAYANAVSPNLAILTPQLLVKEFTTERSIGRSGLLVDVANAVDGVTLSSEQITEISIKILFQKAGLCLVEKQCPKGNCRKWTTTTWKDGVFTFRCKEKCGRKSYSMYEGSFLDGMKMPPHRLLWIFFSMGPVAILCSVRHRRANIAFAKHGVSVVYLGPRGTGRIQSEPEYSARRSRQEGFCGRGTLFVTVLVLGECTLQRTLPSLYWVSFFYFQVKCVPNGQTSARYFIFCVQN